MAEQSKGLYLLFGSQSVSEVERKLNFILQQMADRLDQLEGLKGTTELFKTRIDFDEGQDLTAGKFLRSTSTTRAEFKRIEAWAIPVWKADGTYDPIYLTDADKIPLWDTGGSKKDFALTSEDKVPFYVAAGTADDIALRATLHGY